MKKAVYMYIYLNTIDFDWLPIVTLGNSPLLCLALLLNSLDLV